MVTAACDSLIGRVPHDGLDRLLTAHRGTLAGTHPAYTGVSSPTFKQEWKDDQGAGGLDSLGNWRAFRQATNGGSFTGSADLTQTRTHNPVKEITEFSAPAAPADPPQGTSGGPGFSTPHARTHGMLP